MRSTMTTIAATAAVLCLAGTGVAFAAADQAPAAHGKATAPGRLCAPQSHKKTNHGKGKSPFAACVIGATRAQDELATRTSSPTAPGQLCKGQARKKRATDTKSPFAACVSGAAKAQHEQGF